MFCHENNTVNKNEKYIFAAENVADISSFVKMVFTFCPLIINMSIIAKTKTLQQKRTGWLCCNKVLT